MNRDFSYNEMRGALEAMACILEGQACDYDVILSRYGKIGELVAQIDLFQV